MLFVKTKDSNGQDVFAYYHHDHLGTPVQATDKQGNVVWAASYEPFGKATITTPAATADKPTISSSLRFPGQMEDVETGLYYNWHRYYDPEVGRYLAPDPIGLDGGMNLYSFVGGDPMNWMDPEGLESMCPLKKKCVGKARVREGRPKYQEENKIGAFGVGVKDGLAIIPSQWGWTNKGKGRIRPHLNAISGTLSDGTPLFDKITDIQDHREFGTTAEAQERIIKDSGGNLVLEIYGQKDLGVQGVVIYVPPDVACPFGTKEAK